MLTHCDPSELPQASVTHEHKPLEAICQRCNKPGDAICPHCHHEYTDESLAEDPSLKLKTLQRFADLARHIQARRNAKFWWVCFLVATGDADADGRSMTQIAAEWGVGKATVSKICVSICARLGIPPSRAMLSSEARNSYKKSNRRKTKTTQ